MAFCNSCGAALNPGTKFCNKCGVAASAVPSAPAVGTVPAAPGGGGSSALKIILIVLGVIVLIGILGMASIGFFAYRVAKNAHVTQEGDHVKVDTPFGTVETSKDSSAVVQSMGVEIYPGAQVQKNGASTASFGPIHTATATFESTDPMDKVCAFYKSKFPNAVASTSETNRCTVVSNDSKNMITVNIEASGDVTKFQITSVTKKGASGSSN
jgi:hypothetical protein